MFTSAELLALGDDELVTLLTTLTKNAREELWVKYEDTALTSATRYRIPRRASLRMLRAVSLVDSAGNESPLTGTDATTAAEGGLTWSWTGVGPARGPAYYLEDDFLVFLGTPPAGYSVRMRYLRRPSRLIAVASCAAIQKPGSTTILVLSTSQPDAALAASMYVDIVRGDAPFDLMYVDRKVSAYSASASITFDSSTPVVVADFVNRDTFTNDRVDYVCPRDRTCYPPLPIELHPVLVSATVRRVLEELRDPGLEAAEQTLKKRLEGATSAVQPRVQTENKRLVNTAAFGGGGFGGRRFRR